LKEHTVGRRRSRRSSAFPRKVADLLALAGIRPTTSRVPGIGEKTASELIRDFGSLDAVLAHPSG